MKKITSLILALICVLAVSSTSFAAGFLSSGGGLKLGAGGATTAPAIIIGLSPKVVAYYFTDGTTVGTAQWYAIGTGHPGGTAIYATAQDLNNLYKQDYTTGDTIDATLFALPSEPASAVEWSNGGWTL